MWYRLQDCVLDSPIATTSLLFFALYAGFLFTSVSASNSCTKHAQITYLPTNLLWSHSAALLKGAPLLAQCLLLFLAHILSFHLLLPVPPFGIPYPLMSAIPLLRPSFALNLKTILFSFTYGS